jgi:hypothetical protein
MSKQVDLFKSNYGDFNERGLVEGQERFDGLQKFFSTIHKLTSERRRSRFVFVAEKS